MWTRNAERQKLRAAERDLTCSFIHFNTGNFNYLHLEFVYETCQHLTSLIPDTETLKPIFKLYVLFMQIEETVIQIEVIILQAQIQNKEIW